MKKQIIASAAFLLTSSVAMAQSGTFQLKANLKNLGDTIIVHKGRGEKRDTILVKKDKFTYTANLDAPKSLLFAQPALFRGQDAEAFQLVCVPGENATLTGDVKAHYDISGSNFYKQYQDVHLMQEALVAEREKAERENSPISGDAFDQKVLSFIAQHPSNEASAITISYLNSLEHMEKAVSLLADPVKNGRMKAYYQPIVDRAKARKEADEKAKVVQASGAEASDFTLKDIQGNDFTLSSLRGKYVILDFWGSWCIWCIKGMPKMKEYYEKYKGKFEIVGIDCNDSDAKWKAAVEKYQLPWIHVYNPKTSDVLCKYAIQGFPTKIVVGPDGKIVKTIVGEDPAFYTFLDDTFGK